LDRAGQKGIDAGDKIADGMNRAKEAADEAADAVEGVSYGHSPGGLKDIIAMSRTATNALADFGRLASGMLVRAGKDVDMLAKKLNNLKPPKGWKGDAADEYTDLARQIAILTAGSELAKDKLRLKFAEEDEIAALRANKDLTKAQRDTLIAMVRRKYDLLMAELLAEYRRRAEENAPGTDTSSSGPSSLMSDPDDRMERWWRNPEMSQAAPAPVQITINANGSFFDTPASLQQLANKVSLALTQDLRRQTRLAS